MRPIHLVCHAAADSEPGLPPSRWQLGPFGAAAAMDLADRLPRYTPVILSSTSAVAAQTARSIVAALGDGTEVLLEDSLVEVGRPDVVAASEPAVVRRYLDGDEIEGWEPQDEAVGRFRRGLGLAMARSVRAEIVVSHAVIMSLWLAPRLGTTPFTVWEGLGEPDAWRYDPTTDRVSRAMH